MIPHRLQLRSIEAEGFYHGVHLVSSEPTEAQIGARFDGDAHQVRHDAVDATKQIEAQAAVLEARQPEVEQHWRRLADQTAGLRPEIAMPMVATAAATLAVMGETLLLAPVMDGFGIAASVWQGVTAATLVVVASGLLHLALRRVHGILRREETVPTAVHHEPMGVAVTVALALFALATVTTLGWWRAAEMIFAADAQQGEWARFLRQNDLLTKICVTLLTLGLPFFAAASSDWGFARMRYALEWRRARTNHLRLTQLLETARKRLQALIEKRDQQIQMVEQQKQTWLQSYRENYQMGEQIGAQRPAAWRIVLHISAVALLIAAVCAVADVWLQLIMPAGRMWLYGCLTLGLSGLYAHFALKAWERPTPLQLYRQRAVVWREPKRTGNQ